MDELEDRDTSQDVYRRTGTRLTIDAWYWYRHHSSIQHQESLSHRPASRGNKSAVENQDRDDVDVRDRRKPAPVLQTGFGLRLSTRRKVYRLRQIEFQERTQKKE